MKIGVISEGPADRAVVSNILSGFNGIDISDIIAIRPADKYDETDKSALNPMNFSNWSLVREECKSRELINEFLLLEGQDFIVIHIDTAEADQYGITRPNKGLNSYCEDLRNLVIAQINNWLGQDMSEVILYAVAIEETDAWVLTIYDDKDSSKSADPKRKLNFVLNGKKINSTSNYDNFLSISEALSKPKMLKKEKYLDRNGSLKAFYDEIELKVVPKL